MMVINRKRARAGAFVLATALLTGAVHAGVSALAQDGPIAPPLARTSTIVARPEAVVLLGIARAGPSLVAVGERGVIVRSHDDGRHWAQVLAPTSVTLTGVTFPSARVGYAVGFGGIVLKTEDGGASWKTTLDGRRALDLATADARRDGRRDADRVRVLMQQIGPDSPFLTAHFFDPSDGIVAGGNGLMFATADGGAHWTSRTTRIDDPEGLHYYALAENGNALYLAGEEGRFFRSHDRGASFARIRLPYAGTFFAVASARPGEFLVGGLRGNVFFSRDDGRHIARIDTPMPVSVSAITVRSDGTYELANQAGAIMTFRSNERRLHAVPLPPLPPVASLVRAADGALVTVGFGGATRVDGSRTTGAAAP